MNAWLAGMLRYHPALFIAVKGALCLIALVLAARLAQRQPRLVVWLLRALILVYVAYDYVHITHVFPVLRLTHGI